MGPPFIAMGFGLVVLASAFRAVIFFRAWRSPPVEVDPRYHVVIGALIFGAVGTMLWAFNPLMLALGWGELNGVWMFIASLLLLVSSVALIGSTAMGGAKTMLTWFTAFSIVWIVGVLVWWYLL